MARFDFDAMVKEVGEAGIAYIENEFGASLADVAGALALMEKREKGLVVEIDRNDDDYDGLKVKYRVFKARNGEQVENCFVLRPDKDPAARAALRTYADVTLNDQLKYDLYSWVCDMEAALKGEKDESKL
ncbi:hypothetical protein LJC60_01030 [Ruminococcaceae bacterium OttesenSCG-928-D13]|nr:hypothetical protein [Ruminococcaceae bacterium OttesenSCG-928-D13]